MTWAETPTREDIVDDVKNQKEELNKLDKNKDTIISSEEVEKQNWKNMAEINRLSSKINDIKNKMEKNAALFTDKKEYENIRLQVGGLLQKISSVKYAQEQIQIKNKELAGQQFLKNNTLLTTYDLFKTTINKSKGLGSYAEDVTNFIAQAYGYSASQSDIQKENFKFNYNGNTYTLANVYNDLKSISTPNEQNEFEQTNAPIAGNEDRGVIYQANAANEWFGSVVALNNILNDTRTITTTNQNILSAYIQWKGQFISDKYVNQTDIKTVWLKEIQEKRGKEMFDMIQTIVDNFPGGDENKKNNEYIISTLKNGNKDEFNKVISKSLVSKEYTWITPENANTLVPKLQQLFPYADISYNQGTTNINITVSAQSILYRYKQTKNNQSSGSINTLINGGVNNTTFRGLVNPIEQLTDAQISTKEVLARCTNTNLVPQGIDSWYITNNIQVLRNFQKTPISKNVTLEYTRSENITNNGKNYTLNEINNTITGLLATGTFWASWKLLSPIVVRPGEYTLYIYTPTLKDRNGNPLDLKKAEGTNGFVKDIEAAKTYFRWS